jgi:predicted flap endonuclease-1-like 5' DNA nuclease
MVKFAQLSKPLRPFERKGLLANVAKERADLEEQLITDGKIIADVLNRSRGGEFGIAQLIDRVPEMKNALRAYWSRSLAEGKEKLTVGDFRKFLDSNEDILRRVGLYDDFAKAGNPLAVLNQSMKEAEGALPALKETVVARGTEQAAAKKTMQEQERLLAKARERETAARDVAPRTEIETEAEKAAAGAKTKLTEEAKVLEKTKAKPEAVINDFVQLKNELDTAAATQIPGIGRSIAKKLLDEGVINEASHLELLQKLRMLETQAKTAEDARKLTKMAVIGILGAGAGTLGVRGIQWGVGRIFTGGQ